MKYKIILENKKQGEIIRNTLEACQFVHNYFIDYIKNHYIESKKLITMTKIKEELNNIKKTRFINYKNNIDAKALEMKLVDIYNLMKNTINSSEDISSITPINNANRYKTSGRLIILDGNKMRIPKLSYINIDKQHQIKEPTQSNSGSMELDIIHTRDGYFVMFDENKMTNNMENKSAIKDKEWDELYQYVKKEIMEFKDNMALPNQMILRLKGIAEGKLLANRNIKARASYTYEQVLLTFKYCKIDIQRCIRTKKFKTEQQKFNYIAKIIETNIVEVVGRINYIKKQEQSFEKNLEKLDIPTNTTLEDNYKKKTKEINKASRLKDLW